MRLETGKTYAGRIFSDSIDDAMASLSRTGFTHVSLVGGGGNGFDFTATFSKPTTEINFDPRNDVHLVAAPEPKQASAGIALGVAALVLGLVGLIKRK